LAFLNRVRDLRGSGGSATAPGQAIQWGQTFLWDLKFEDAPAPFNEWFPAADVEENIYTLESLTIQGFMSTYKVPKSTTVFDLKVTFYDDENHVLLDWLAEWVNGVMLGSGNYVATLQESCRIVSLARLNSLREAIGVTTFWVYPEEALYFHS